MTLLTVVETAAFLKFKNPNSLYNNRTIPRVYIGRRVRFVKEELEQWLQRKTDQVMAKAAQVRKPGPMFRIKVPR
jgi:predicted DNA-binding transcriptional regulator AlpA